MPPKRRKAENKHLPKGWRLRYNSYYYRVPADQRVHWDNLTEFRLGRTLAEAHRVFAERIAQAEGPSSAEGEYPTMAHLLDHYLCVVTPTKAAGTQPNERRVIGRLRGIYGELRPSNVTPQRINRVKHATAAQRGARTANGDLAVLSHVFTMALEWGAIDRHPMLNKQVTRVKVKKGAQGPYIPTDADIEFALPYASPLIEAYVQIKIRTGLRQTDMLRLKRSDDKPDGLHVTTSKTGAAMVFEWSPDLRHWFKKACAVNTDHVASIWVFQTLKGTPYINDENRADGFGTLWQRWMRKVVAAGGQRFAERYLRNKVGDDSASDEDARARLGHESITTTRKHYRAKPSRVTPIKRPTE